MEEINIANTNHQQSTATLFNCHRNDPESEYFPPAEVPIPTKSMETQIATNIPPAQVWRNQHGLMENVKYVYDDNGFVNWRKMIPNEFLVPNAEKTSEKDVTKLQDKDLIILLGGLKYLAQLRGYTFLDHHVIESTSAQVTVVCRITWVGNYETSNQPVTFAAIAEANLNNTKGFGQNFLASIAENRAFCRAVRNFLKINIVSYEELGPDKDNPENEAPTNTNLIPQQPYAVLAKLMDETNLNFEKLKAKLIKENQKNADRFERIEDIPIVDAYKLIERIRNKILDDNKKKNKTPDIIRD